MIFKYIKFLFFFFVGASFYFLGIFYGAEFGPEVTNYVIFPLVFISINYAFIKLILYYIKYYNNLIILYKDQIIVIKSSLLNTDNVELIDLHKITKLDTFRDGIIPNVVGYGILVIEQQRDKVREFWYVPEPHKAIGFFNEARDRLSQKGKLIEK